jgi:glycosyltransferase involved in cell wall biosynthesis
MLSSVVAQTFKDWELVLVDDGSTEDIKALVESFKDERIRLIRWDDNKGMPHGMNHALSMATGEYIGMLSADEMIWADKLAVQVEYMDAHKGVDCVWGLPLKGDLGLRPLWEQSALRAHNRSNEAWLRTLLNLENVPIGGASLLMRTEVMKSLGYLDPTLRMFSDHELFCKFFSRGHVGVILPYRFAVEHTTDGDEDVKKKQRYLNFGKMDDELGMVRSRYPLKLPATTGKVSIGLPCFNDSNFLPDAVAAIMAQTHQDWELMILNDGGTDDFNTVVQQFTDPRIKVLAFDENRGMWEAQNQMAFRATGEFYMPVSADDTIEPTFIEKCLAEYAKNPWLEMVASQTDFMNEDKIQITNKSDASISNVHIGLRMLMITKPTNMSREHFLGNLYGGNLYFGVGMYRTKTISDVGGWEKQYKVLADYQMYVKILQRDQTIQIIEEPLTHTRVHGKNASVLTAEKYAELPQLYHDAKKPYFRQLMKVVIATPFYELKGFSPYITSLQATIRLLTANGIDWRFMELSGDSYVHRARNTMCDTFLSDPDATDLFFIDSDMSWNPEAFVHMCLQPEELVGGAYPVKNCWEAWTSIPHWQLENNENVLKGRPLGDGTALIEAFVLAGGFLRIKRSALEKFRKNYPDLWYAEPSSSPTEPGKRFTQFFGAESVEHRFFGEDHMFSKHMRDMGMKMYIYPNVDLTHWGYQNFPGNFDQFLKKRAADMKKIADVQVAEQRAQVAS